MAHTRWSRHGKMVRGVLLASAGVVAVSAMIDAQAAIFVARRVLGRVETMSQQSTQKDGPGYDSAAVMLEAPAKQVYATALNALRRAQAQGISITRHENQSARRQAVAHANHFGAYRLAAERGGAGLRQRVAGVP